MDYEEDVYAIITLFSSKIYSLIATRGAVANSRYIFVITIIKISLSLKPTGKKCIAWITLNKSVC